MSSKLIEIFSDEKLIEKIKSRLPWRLFDRIGRQNYIKLPKPGTNPRGAEITKEALSNLARDKDTKSIEILWKKTVIEFNPYKRWVDYWKED